MNSPDGSKSPIPCVFPKRKPEDIVVNTAYRILYEDECLIAVDKPSPLAVHAVGSYKEKNLLTLLGRVEKYQGLELRIVNRLDAETSGLVIVARTREAASRIGKQFQNRKVSKEYQAIVFGIPQDKTGEIALPLGLESENECHYRIHDPEGEKAVTRYEVIGEGNGYAFLKINPLTGRMHQIRAHLAFIGHPVVGDKLYINRNVFKRYIQFGWLDEMLEIVGMNRLALHASRLSLVHPLTGKALEFSAGMPEEFLLFMNSVGLLPCP
jgi:23S rRNA pseudouridine1911/1915/1917 synthase